MKLTYISNSILPSRSANSVHVMKMCQAFANYHEVTLLAPDRSEEYEPEISDVYSFYNVNKNFTIHKLPWVKLKGRTLWYGWQAARYAKRHKADLVYGRYVTGCLFAALLGIPTIIELHSLTRKQGFDGRVLSFLLRHKNVQRVVVISDALKQAVMHEYDLTDEKILVAHDGADKVQNTETLSLTPPDGIHVGYVGQLFAGKGMELIAQLPPLFPEGIFHIVGGNEKDIAYWKECTKDYPNIIYHGFVTQKEAEQFRNSFDIVLAPYQSTVTTHGGSGDIAKWMSPLKLFEYMAAKKAIIASDLPVLREVLTHQHNALLCSPEQPQEWVAALWTLSDETKRLQLSEVAYQNFLQNHTWQQRAKNVLNNLH